MHNQCKLSWIWKIGIWNKDWGINLPSQSLLQIPSFNSLKLEWSIWTHSWGTGGSVQTLLPIFLWLSCLPPLFELWFPWQRICILFHLIKKSIPFAIGRRMHSINTTWFYLCTVWPPANIPSPTQTQTFLQSYMEKTGIVWYKRNSLLSHCDMA